MTVRRSPTVRRRRLGLELRRLREAAGLTIEQVAKATSFSQSKVSRIENGRVSATPRDVRVMLDRYGVSREQRDALTHFAREAQQRGWWQAYGDAQAMPLVGLEVGTASIRVYEPLLVPGLLQTEKYAQAVLRAALPGASDERIEHLVELRMSRQSLLTREDPPAFWAVIDEAALRRPVGGPETMRKQLHHLVDVGALPNVRLQVLALAGGEHAGMNGQFVILTFAEQADPDLVYLEHNANDLYLESTKEVQRYAVLFERVSDVALEVDESAAFLAALADEL